VGSPPPEVLAHCHPERGPLRWRLLDSPPSDTPCAQYARAAQVVLVRLRCGARGDAATEGLGLPASLRRAPQLLADAQSALLRAARLEREYCGRIEAASLVRVILGRGGCEPVEAVERWYAWGVVFVAVAQGRKAREAR
jgi:hypothetical protein